MFVCYCCAKKFARIVCKPIHFTVFTHTEILENRANKNLLKLDLNVCKADYKGRRVSYCMLNNAYSTALVFLAF